MSCRGVLVVSLFAVGVLTGCPSWWNPQHFSFLSADPYRNSNMTDGPPYGQPGGVDDSTGEEGEAEREVVEPDVIRRDGNWLYVLNQYRGLSIVDLDSETLVSQAPTYGYPRDLYLVGDRAYVLVAYAGGVVTVGDALSYDIESRVYVLDVADPSKPAIIGEFDLAGDFVDSRLVGDVLYAISAEYQWAWVDDVVMKTKSSSSWVTSLNVADPEHIYHADQMSFEGYGDVIQATNFALFVAASDWNTGDSVITYLDISDPAGLIEVRDAIQVHGQVADRFKMDAYNGVLRVVSNTWWPQRDVFVTTVDLANPDELLVMGQATIPDAAGETLFATRFDGPRAYVVTYFVQDPLFVLDLSDPANPVVAGLLEAPGWSTHIEPRGDRLIALGVDDVDGRRVKVSMYDVSDPAAPAEVDTVSFGEGWSWSSAFEDVKAFTVLDDMLVVPFSGWSEGAGGFDRLQFVGWTPGNLEEYGYVDVDGQILRSFAYGDAFYGVTTEQLAVIDASDPNAPEVTNRITLAEYVADFQELSDGLGVEVVSRFDDATTAVRTVDAAGAALGEIKLDVYNVANTFVHGQELVLVATDWDETSSFYRVVIVNCTDPVTPVVRVDQRVDVVPFWGWGYGWDGPPMADGAADAPGAAEGAAGSATEKSMPYAYWWYPWYQPSETVFKTGGQLALRCTSASYDVVFGGGQPSEGIAVFDLQSGAWVRTVGLAYDFVVSLNSVGERLYLSTKETAGTTFFGQPLAAYFMRELDIAAPVAGPAANVPGEYVNYDPVRDLLLVRDYQYELSGDIAQSVKCVRWDGGEAVELLDTFALPGSMNSLLARGAWVYVEQYGSACEVLGLRVTAGGDIEAGPKVKVSDGWVRLIDADDAKLYVDAGGRALARYDFADGGALADLTQVMSSPLRARFGETTAYVPLGYSGLVRLAR